MRDYMRMILAKVKSDLYYIKGKASNNSLLILSEFSIDEISIQSSLDYPPYLIADGKKKNRWISLRGKLTSNDTKKPSLKYASVFFNCINRL